MSLIPKNKKERTAMLVGMGVAFVAGAFLPDKFNPIVIISNLMKK